MKYRDGTDGLLERFMAVFNQLSKIQGIALSLHARGLEMQVPGQQKGQQKRDAQVSEALGYIEGILTLLHNM